jgi:hypothetical protein
MQPNAGFLVLWTEQQFDGGEHVTRMQFFSTREDAETFARDHLSEDSFRPSSHAHGKPGVFVVDAAFYGQEESA